MKKKTKIIIVVSVLFVILLNILIRLPKTNTVTTKPETISLSPDVQANIEKLIKDDLLYIEAESNKAYISPLLWVQIDAITKENFTKSVAIYCAAKKKSDLVYVTMLDKQSGVKLAKYGAWGYDVYN